MHNMKKKAVLAVLVSVLAVGAPVFPVYASLAGAPGVACQSAILIEETSGKVLFEKNADARMYPASLTKILTALMTLSYLQPDEYVVTGSEINEVPWDSSKANHLSDETLLVEHLVRGLIIPSGNETACVAAKAVALRNKGVAAMAYRQAEAEFCDLMNEYAKGIGARNTNFVNPHGYHHEEHYSTARDLALISQAAMAHPLIRSISGEKEFSGNGAGENADPAWKTKDYVWPTHNQLIVPSSEFYYQYASGIKTGFTDEAGYCLAALAEKDGRRLIAVVLNDAEEDDRWFDARELFEYGFSSFDDRKLQTKGEVICEVEVYDVRLGEDNTLKLMAAEDVVRYMSMDEVERIEREVTLLPERVAGGQNDRVAPPVAESEPIAITKLRLDGETLYEGELLSAKGIVAPVKLEEPIASIRLSLDGETVYEGELLAAGDMEARTLKTDLQYYVDKLIASAFSLAALPYWIGGLAAILIFIRVVVIIRRRRQRRRSKNPYRFTKPRGRY